MAISFVSAVPPVQTTLQDTGLSIAYPQYQTIPLNTGFNLSIHVYNSSQYMTGSDATCYFDLYDQLGNEDMSGQFTAGSRDYFIPINASNFTTDGQYSFVIECNTSMQVGFANGVFEATESGIVYDEGRSLLAVGILLILVIFLFASIYSLTQVEDYRGKFALYWVSHLFAVLVCFVGWQIGVEGLLGGIAVVGIFRVLFWFFLIASFPMLILSLAWVFYIHTMNDHFKKLIDKGEDPETAFKIAQKKSRRGGW